MLGPFATKSRLTPIQQMSLAVLLRAACASMSTTTPTTTTTTTTTRDRGDRYGPMEWAQWLLLTYKVYSYYTLWKRFLNRKVGSTVEWITMVSRYVQQNIKLWRKHDTRSTWNALQMIQSCTAQKHYKWWTNNLLKTAQNKKCKTHPVSPWKQLWGMHNQWWNKKLGHKAFNFTYSSNKQRPTRWRGQWMMTVWTSAAS